VAHRLSGLAARISPLLLAALGRGQSATVVHFPQPGGLFGEASFAVGGATGFVPTVNDDVLWSFSLTTGALLDADGLALPTSGIPGTAPTGAYYFPVGRVALPGSFPSQGVLVADVSDPSHLEQAGVITFPSTASLQTQEIVVDASGRVGFIASRTDHMLYSFDVLSLTLLDQLALPGTAAHIALAGNRLAMLDTTDSSILVADVSDPDNLALVGSIALPIGTVLTSYSDVGFATDGRTGFASSLDRVLFSFDVQTLGLLDPDGVVYGATSFGSDIAIHGHSIACVSSRGLSFIDASDPTQLRVMAEADFGGVAAMQSAATAAFSSDGLIAAVPTIFPGNQIHAFDVATGAPVGLPFAVDAQPNFTAALGTTDRLGVVCSMSGSLWLIDGLLDSTSIASYCDAKVNSCDALPTIGYSGVSSATASGGFQITATGARSARNGILLYGRSATYLPFEGGTLCVGPQGSRRGPLLTSIGGSPDACDATFVIDMNAFAAGLAGGNPATFLQTIGERVYAQWWGRDTGEHGCLLSNALQYVIGP
jgi:hypothetical protein